MIRRRSKNIRPRQGAVLIVVLVVVVLLALAAYGFTEIMIAEHEAADAGAPASQAMALADSGAAYVQAVLLEDAATRESSGGIYTNPTRFEAREVCDDGYGGAGRFSVLSPAISAAGAYDGVRYGLEDESAKLNLLAVLAEEQGQPGRGRERLMALPGMTEDIADAILDWLDSDDEIREFGAEIEYYAALDPPYAPTNGPPESLEQLLLVRGMTPGLWFGMDLDRSGLVEDFEQQAATAADADHSRGEMYLGWSSLVTIYSKEAAPSSDEQPIDLNGQDLETLHKDLAGAFSKDWADFIIAFRQNGAYNAGAGGAGAGAGAGGGGVGAGGSGTSAGASGGAGGNQQFGGPATGDLDFSQQGGTQLETVLDLVGIQVRVRFLNEEQDSLLTSPFPDRGSELKESLPKLLSRTTTGSSMPPAGRVNINQAPAPVLRSLRGVTEEMSQAILSKRESEPIGDESPYRYPTWLYTEDVVNLQTMKQILPRVCCGGAVYRASITGYFDRGGPAARIEAIFDASSSAPRLLFWRDVTHLGRGAAPLPASTALPAAVR